MLQRGSWRWGSSVGMPGRARAAEQGKQAGQSGLSQVTRSSGGGWVGPAPWQSAGGCCDTPSWPHLPSCPSSRSSFLKHYVRLAPGGVSFCSSCGRRMLLAGSSSLLPAATPQGQGVQAPVAVTQGLGTCCGAERGEAGALELLLQSCTPPSNILQPPLSRRLLLFCCCLHPRVWTGQDKCLLGSSRTSAAARGGCCPAASHVSC